MDYLDGFSPNVQDILDNFEFRNQIPSLDRADALGALITPGMRGLREEREDRLREQLQPVLPQARAMRTLAEIGDDILAVER